MVRTQLEQVEAHLAETLTHFDERDREIAEQLEQQVREHGELITNETARIVESMQSYVQGGAEAIGRLAQRIEEHAKLFVLQDHNITQHVIDAVDVTGEDVMGQLELIKEKVGLHGRDQEQLQAAIERMIDARMRGMAELVRSDSLALQKLVEERMAAPSFVVGEDGQVAFDEASLDPHDRPAHGRARPGRRGADGPAGAHDEPSRCSRCRTRRPRRWSATSSG